MSYHNTRTVLVVPFVLALLGCLFAGWNALDAASVPCVTVGCTVYQSFSVGGYSLWWGGVAAFTVLMVVALMGQASLGYFLAGMGLGLDCVLLIIMAVTAPCLACLLIALLLALCFRAFREEALRDWRSSRNSTTTSWLLLVWSALFIMNIGLVGRTAFQPWAIAEPQQESARIHVYFSPSCSACRQLLQGISKEDAASIAWYPVSEDPRDLAIISAMAQQLGVSDKPIGAVFDEASNAPALGPLELLQPKLLMLQFKLWRNQAHVLVSADGHMPFVEFRGLPMGLMKNGNKPARPSSPSSTGSSTLPLDLSLGGVCTGGSTPGTDCP